MLLHSPYIQGACDFYSSLPSQYTKFVCRSFVHGEIDLELPQLKLIAHPCHMNPWAYYQPFLFLILQLTASLELLVLLLVSLFQAWVIIPNSTTYFVAVAKTTLAHKGRAQKWSGAQAG
jgi:hypothetical protein